MAQDDVPRHPKSNLADAGLPDVEIPYHTGVDADRVTSHNEQTRNSAPEEELYGNTILSDLPNESGNFRPLVMQSAYFSRRLDQLGEMPLSGLHGRVTPLAQPSRTMGEPDFYEQGYLVRQIPSNSSDDLGLVV
jgi:hypothetical protein